MIKVMVLVSRLPHIDREGFKTYYETRHAPMVLSLMPTLRGYERNYPDVSKVRPPEGKTVDEVVDFDAITVFRFEDREGFNAFKAVLRDPEVARIIQADEANFLDNTKTRLFLVEESLTPAL
jgi:uncharacterized protein (TIGR02118 family)